MFKKNERSLMHGNSIETVGKEFCRDCGADITTASKCMANSFVLHCPHTVMTAKQEWKIGDLVTTADDDGSMGPAEIVAMPFEHQKGAIVLVRYLKYADTNILCYRPKWYSDLLPIVKPEEQRKPRTDHISTLRQLLNIILKAWKEEGMTLEDI